ncbi:MAG: MaoC family dehydratase [Parasphingorhabdus sp.]
MTEQYALESALKELDLKEKGPIGTSPWITITQEDIDGFGKVTRDLDPMHVDPEWCAAKGPFPTTIAFGFLSLSLITHMSHEAREWTEGTYALNYGFNKVRFVAPVPVGSRVRGHFTFMSAKPRDDGSILTTTAVTVEIDGEERPAVTAEWLGVFYPPSIQKKLV